MVKLQSFLMLSLAATALAAPSWWEQWSLGKKTNRVAHDEDRRLVQTSELQAPFWTSEAERLDMLRNNVNYMDITDYMDLGTSLKPLGKKCKSFFLPSLPYNEFAHVRNEDLHGRCLLT